MVRRSPSGMAPLRPRRPGATPTCRCGGCVRRAAPPRASTSASRAGGAVDLDRLAAGVLGHERGRPPDRDGLAVRHDRHRVREALGLLDVVRRHQDRDALARAGRRSAPTAPGGPAGRGRPSARPSAAGAGGGRAPARSAAAGACRPTACRPSCRAGRPGSRSRPRGRRLAPLAAGDPVQVREHAQVLLDRERDVEVVELRHDAHLARASPWSRRAARRPSTSSSPSSAIAWAVSIFIVVLLPAPLGPSRPTHVPSGTSRSSPSTATTGP